MSYKVGDKVFFKACTPYTCELCEQEEPNLKPWIQEGEIIEIYRKKMARWPVEEIKICNCQSNCFCSRKAVTLWDEDPIIEEMFWYDIQITDRNLFKIPSHCIYKKKKKLKKNFEKASPIMIKDVRKPPWLKE